MRKFFKISFIVFVVIFIAIMSIPFLFKGEIINLAKQEIHKNVKAQVDWDKISVSLFRGFPDLKVSLYDFSVTGIDDFAGDTLVALDDLSVKVDLLSVFRGNVKVKSIILNDPVMRAIVQEDGKVNWDIAYPSEEEVPDVEEDTTELDIEISLKEFLINNADIRYIDDSSKIYATISDFDFDLSGNFSQQITDLDVGGSINALSVNYQGIRYLNNTELQLQALINADLEENVFTLNNNQLRLNELVLGLEGFFKILEGEGYEVDLNFSAQETSFKSLLSMVPAIYMQDFEDLNTSGNLSLNGSARGRILGSELPEVNLNLLVNQGYFSYPDLPGSVDDVNLDLKIFYNGVYPDNSRIDLDRLHMEIEGNPLNAHFHMITPMTDMQVNGAIEGTINLSLLKDAIPMENMDLQGMIYSDLEFMGKMSDIEEENYEAFKANGQLEIQDILVQGDEIPAPVYIEQARMVFSPRFVNLENFDARIGSSNIQMAGRLQNFIPYLFRKGVVEGELVFTSSMLNINELMAMAETAEEEEEVEDTTALSVIEVPERIDFRLQTRIDSLIYDDIHISDLVGLVIVHDGMIDMENLSMDMLEGRVIMSGNYDTRDITSPMVDFNMSMRQIDIPSTFSAFNTVEKLAPVASYARGKVNAQVEFSSFLDSAMNPVYPSIVGKGSLKTNEVKIENNETLDKVASLLNYEGLTDNSFRNVNLDFEIRNGRVFVQPFDVSIGQADVTIGGDQGIDQTMNYFMNFSIPREQFGNSLNDLVEDLSMKAREQGFAVEPGEDVNIQVEIKGTFSDPEISLDLKENMQEAKEQIKEAVQDRVEEEVEKIKEEAQARLDEEIESIMQEAREEAEKVKEAARDAGQRLIDEAKRRREQLIDEAGSNPLKKLAAEKTGDELVKRAQQQAENLENEASKQADNILERAKERAESLKSQDDDK